MNLCGLTVKARGREMETLSAGLSPPPSAAPFLEKKVGSRSSVRDIFFTGHVMPGAEPGPRKQLVSMSVEPKPLSS